MRWTKFILIFAGAGTASAMAVLACSAAVPPAPDCRTVAADAEARVGAALEDGAAAPELVADLAACLGDPEPAIRDGMAYENLTRLMREGLVAEPDRRDLLVSLSAALQPEVPDGEGFLKPFAALVLSEVARTDRVDPWMSDEERGGLVDAATAYLRGVRDYRGFVDGAGWRHGVAHGADLLMQLSLNPEIGHDQGVEIADAVFATIGSAEAPAFIFDEPGRLSRPLLFLTQRGQFTGEQLAAWFEALADPAPLASWDEAFRSESELARRHNVRAFAYAVLVSATESGDENLAMLRPGALHVLTTIP